MWRAGAYAVCQLHNYAHKRPSGAIDIGKEHIMGHKQLFTESDVLSSDQRETRQSLDCKDRLLLKYWGQGQRRTSKLVIVARIIRMRWRIQVQQGSYSKHHINHCNTMRLGSVVIGCFGVEDMTIFGTVEIPLPDRCVPAPSRRSTGVLRVNNRHLTSKKHDASICQAVCGWYLCRAGRLEAWREHVQNYRVT